MTAGLVIVGGGQAASSAAAKIRELDPDIPVTMICGENTLPYQRPPLSKKYLSGEMPLDRLVLRPDDWFDEQNVAVERGRFASRIDCSGKTITLDNGKSLAYDKLLLATGARERRLPTSMGGDLTGVHYLRGHVHADEMRPSVVAGEELLVIGGGYIGLEVAAVASQLGLKVTLVEMAERILQRVAAPQTSDYFRSLHHRNGVNILEGVGLESLTEDNGRVCGAKLNDGRDINADLVLVGIGVVPETGLAEQAGLDVDNGITVDGFCKTSDPSVYAAGDCANFEFDGKRIRLESVPNAIHQAETAAKNMLGATTPYRATPWFWSDQYDVKLQIAGLNMGFDDTVIRPGKREGAQSVWYYKGDQLLAVDAMNDAPAFMMARRIIEAGKTVPKDVAADASSNLKEWA